MSAPHAAGESDVVQDLRRKLAATRVSLVDERVLLGDTDLARAFGAQVSRLEAELAELEARDPGRG